MISADKFTITPTTSWLMRRLYGYRQIEATATKHVTLCESEPGYNRPSIALNNQLERVVGVHEFSAGLEDEIDKATRRTQHHDTTIAYKLEDVFLANGKLCNFKDFKNLTYSSSCKSPTLITTEYNKAAMCSTAGGNDYFAHFVFDDACTALAAKDFAPVVFANTGKPRTEHMLSYLALLGMSYEDVSRAWFKELWLFRDFALNSHRRSRLKAMRKHISRIATPGTPACVYIKRGVSGSKRLLKNEDEIIQNLQQCGFQIIDPDNISLIDLVRKINGTPLVVGVEGSHLIHGLLNLGINGTLLCIQPPTRFNAIYRPFTNAVDLDWAYVVGKGNTSEFTLSIEDLMKTLDLCFQKNLQYGPQ